jgi:hypothetical protein
MRRALRRCRHAALALTLALWLGAGGPAPPAAAQRALPAEWQKRYISIAGAWFLERRCAVLDTADRREFEWLAARLTVFHARRIGLARVRKLQDEALRLIGVAPYDGCGTNNRRIVREALPWARADVAAVAGEAYDPASSYRDYALGRFAVSLAGTQAGSRCNLVPEDETARLGALERAVMTGLAEAYGSEPVDRAAARAARLAAAVGAACGPATELRLRAAIDDLRELRREFAP